MIFCWCFMVPSSSLFRSNNVLPSSAANCKSKNKIQKNIIQLDKKIVNFFFIFKITFIWWTLANLNKFEKNLCFVQWKSDLKTSATSLSLLKHFIQFRKRNKNSTKLLTNRRQVDYICLDKCIHRHRHRHQWRVCKYMVKSFQFTHTHTRAHAKSIVPVWQTDF